MGIYIDAHTYCTEHPDSTSFFVHVQEFYEVDCFWAGDVKYYIEGNTYDLHPGDIMLINKAEAHSALIGKSKPYKRQIIHFGAESLLGDTKRLFDILAVKPLGIFNRVHGSAEEKEKWYYYIEKIINSDEDEKRIYLTVLINELTLKISERQQKTSDYSVDEIIEYVNENLFEIQGLATLCEKFYISKTHLNRHFKAMTGSTVWNYITAKRLLRAKDMLNEGVNPTDVYLKLGYKDYAAFYRAYKQKFKTSPKKDHIKK